MISIALISDDGKKPEMVSLVLRNRDFLETCNIYATGTTSSYNEKEGFNVSRLLSELKVGDDRITALLSTEEVDIDIFYRDLLSDHTHDPDVQMPLCLSNVYHAPWATNLKSSFCVIKGIETVRA